MYKITYACKWYEYQYTANPLRNGMYKLSCYCTDPNGYYCPSESWDREVTRKYVVRIFDL
jgi:hypothetical protein